MAAHGTDADTGAVDRDHGAAEVRAQAQNFVALGHPFPFFLGCAVAQIFVNPRDQRAAQGYAEVGGFLRGQAALLGNHLAVDLQNRRLRVVQQGPDFAMERAILRQQFAHMLRATTRSRLVGLRRHPFHQSRLEQRAHAHQHAAHGAVAADPVLAASGHGFVDHGQIHRV